eukprot:56459_1
MQQSNMPVFLDQGCPRVNGSLLGRYVGQTVLLVGQVTQASADQAQLAAADGEAVTVRTNGMAAYETTFVEIKGKVVDQRTIEQEGYCNFGNAFDLGVYNELVKFSNNEFSGGELFV